MSSISPPAPSQVRLLEPADAAAVALLGTTAGLRRAAAATTDGVRAEAARTDRLGVVATTSRDELVGYALALTTPPGPQATWELLEIVVAASARRRGVGRTLVDALSRHADRGGAEALLLEVRAGNTAARALYESLGATTVGQRAGYYPDGEDALVLRLPVPTP